MNVQSVLTDSRLTHMRELKTANERLRAEVARLRDENAALRAHFDLAVLAASDLRSLASDGRLVIVDGWNRILGANRTVRSRDELLERAECWLAARPRDRVWIVFDGNRADVSSRDRLRVSYTGGTGAHRADRFICDFIRMARFAGVAARVVVVTDDRDFGREVRRLGASMAGDRDAVML